MKSFVYSKVTKGRGGGGYYWLSRRSQKIKIRFMWNAPACLKPPIPTTCPEELYKCFCRAGFAACFFLYPIAHQNVWFSIAFCHAWPEHRAPFKTLTNICLPRGSDLFFSRKKRKNTALWRLPGAPRWLKDLRLASLLLFFFSNRARIGSTAICFSPFFI